MGKIKPSIRRAPHTVALVADETIAAAHAFSSEPAAPLELADQVQTYLAQRHELLCRLTQEIEATENKLAELRRTKEQLFPAGSAQISPPIAAEAERTDRHKARRPARTGKSARESDEASSDPPSVMMRPARSHVEDGESERGATVGDAAAARQLSRFDELEFVHETPIVLDDGTIPFYVEARRKPDAQESTPSAAAFDHAPAPATRRRREAETSPHADASVAAEPGLVGHSPNRAEHSPTGAEHAPIDAKHAPTDAVPTGHLMVPAPKHSEHHSPRRRTAPGGLKRVYRGLARRPRATRRASLWKRELAWATRRVRPRLQNRNKHWRLLLPFVSQAAARESLPGMPQTKDESRPARHHSTGERQGLKRLPLRRRVKCAHRRPKAAASVLLRRSSGWGPRTSNWRHIQPRFASCA